ncbi:hypothetical protein CRUP_010340 [Coryphaenoides rupestris]|nr:hypothetical protein CRUP_010340 [Coryphaenoides rupestris]
MDKRPWAADRRTPERTRFLFLSIICGAFPLKEILSILGLPHRPRPHHGTVSSNSAPLFMLDLYKTVSSSEEEEEKEKEMHGLLEYRPMLTTTQGSSLGAYQENAFLNDADMVMSFVNLDLLHDLWLEQGGECNWEILTNYINMHHHHHHHHHQHHHHHLHNHHHHLHQHHHLHIHHLHHHHHHHYPSTTSTSTTTISIHHHH